MLNNHHLLLMMTTRWASSSSSASWSWRMRGWNWTTTTTTTTTTTKKKKDRVFIKQHSSSSNSMTMTHRNRLVGPQLDESTETESRRKSKPTPTKTSNNSNHDHPKSNDAHNNLSSSDRIPASKVSSNKKLIQTNFKNTSSSSSTNFNPELISSFQEPSLVGLTPPLVEQDHHPIPRSPQPPPPRSNPQSNSLTATPSNPTPEFTVLPTHAFHTHRFVTQIERSGIGLQSAKQILTHVEHSLRSSERRWLLTGPSGGIVSKSYAEGQAYLYNAALGELRTEVQVKARNDGIVLKSASNSVQREIDNLKQKLKEDIGALKNELQLEINSRKEEGSDDQKKLELSIQELNSKFTILVSEVRTEIETRKWVTTRRCVVAIASLALCVVIFTALENQSPSSGSSTASSSNLSSSSSPSSSPNPSSEEDRKPSLKDRTMRSVEELGILPEREDYETDYSTSSFFGSLSSSPKRVGE